MTAIKIKGSSKSANKAPAAAAKLATAESISSGDEEAPESSNGNGRDKNSSMADGSSNRESFPRNDEAVADGKTMASSAKAGGGEDDASGDDANHDSNDAAGEDGNGKNGKDPEEEENEEEEEDSPPDDEVIGDADASGNEKQDEEEEGNDEEENLEEDGNEGDEEEGEEMWELKKIFTVEEITKAKPVMCGGTSCPNAACSVYQSDRDTNCVRAWFTCVDCQEK
jgi:hypothetical protein